jgi:hypothetical protein
VLALFVGLVLALNLGGSWLAQQIEFQIFPRHDRLLQGMVLAAAALYLLLMALPFMPGIELGLALLVLLGSKGAVLVYACTVAALCLSFGFGRILSPRLIIRLLDRLHLYRAAALIRELQPMGCSERLQLLTARAPTCIVPFLLAHRYWAIAAALNLPGNALIGGGGGIGLVVGMSGLVPFRHYAGLVALAVAPVPTFFLLSGSLGN